MTGLLLLGLSAPVLASSIPKPEFLPGPEEDVEASETQDYVLNVTIPRVINIGIGVLGIAAFIGILFSAIQMLTAYGNEDKLNKAKTNLRYALIGFVVIILSYAIISVVVAVALPEEEETSESSLIPNAYAIDVEEDIDLLFPPERELIEEQDTEGRVSLPSGEFLQEVVPAAITNVLYFVGFLIFIAFMYGGALLVIGRGNEEYVTKAKKIVTYAAIALALASLGYALIYGIATLQLEEDVTTESDVVYPERAEEDL